MKTRRCQKIDMKKIHDVENDEDGGHGGHEKERMEREKDD